MNFIRQSEFDDCQYCYVVMEHNAVSFTSLRLKVNLIDTWLLDQSIETPEAEHARHNRQYADGVSAR